jgi:hypothetical protein
MSEHEAFVSMVGAEFDALNEEIAAMKKQLDKMEKYMSILLSNKATQSVNEAEKLDLSL